MTDILSAAEHLVRLLAEKHKTVATAESCTGGMIGQSITSVPGASEVYGFGFITYANEAKEKLLGVRHETLRSYGAVSPETAREMAEGARKVSGADIAVAVTGIAGPGGGTPEKPVGLVYVGIAADSGTWAEKLCLSGSRDEIRKQTVLAALELASNKI